MIVNMDTKTKKPFQFQTVVHDLLLANKDVLLQAPPGAGKTRAALKPGMDGFSLQKALIHPQKILYGVPMRTLAKSFHHEYSRIAQERKLDTTLHPTIQTGEMPEDPLLEGRVIFLTVDQLLASFLTLPYGLPRRLDNINAGALVGSYLVFDEFHLYPANEMMLTVLAMCRMLKGLSRFILMSATFSAPFLKAIAKALDAETVVDEPGLNLFADVTPIQTQRRTWRTQEGPLDAAAVLKRRGQRTLVICNQVERAQRLYAALKSQLPAGVDCTLLHSQFYKADRQGHEQQLNKEAFEGDDRPKVIVATQVVEVGLDLSATTLLTECAPAASLIQRAGRCARRENEQGEVYVFQPLDEDGQVNYTPYGSDEGDDGLLEVCNRTWEALNASPFQGKVIDYRGEQALINIAHHDADSAFIDGLAAKIDARISEITDCLAKRDDGYLPKLIRSQPTVSLFIDADPNQKDNLLNRAPHQRESFGVSRGRLHHYFKTLEESNPDTDADFWFMGCTGAASDPLSEADHFEPPIYVWKPITKTDDIYRYRWFVVHPQVLDYTPESGLRFRLPDLAHPAVSSPMGAKAPYEYKPYVADIYVQHLTGLYQAYVREHGGQIRLKQEAAYGLVRLCEQLGYPAESVERLLRLTLALHDVGKLNRPWQAWAAAWQSAYAQQIAPPTVTAADGPLAHTDYDRMDTRQEALKKGFKHAPRGPHAVESAEAALPIIIEACKGDRTLMAVILCAIMRHHTPDADHCDSFHLNEGTQPALTAVLREFGFTDEADRWSQMLNQQFKQSGKSVQRSPEIIQARYEGWYPALLYYLFVRVLRLADQRSGEYWLRYSNLTKEVK
jgi:CRISPR-associated endonuclease/helicase Cas3